jgi:hypothetical protein
MRYGSFENAGVPRLRSSDDNLLRSQPVGNVRVNPRSGKAGLSVLG